MEERLPKRKNIRLKDFDYGSNGYYFITLCIHNMEHLFGTVDNGKMQLNEYGFIVDNNINVMANYRAEISITNYCIMPNHIHLLMGICRERIVCVPSENRTKMEIPKIIQQFKACVTKQCNEICNNGTHTMRSLQWKKSYYEHIVRNEQDYKEIYEYIENNPLKWELDKYYNKQ